MDGFERVHFHAPSDAFADELRLLICDLSQLDACRALLGITSNCESEARSFFLSVKLASVLIPRSRYGLGWNGLETHAHLAARVAFRSLCCEVVAKKIASGNAKAVGNAMLDYDNLSGPIVELLGRPESRSWRPSHTA